MFAFLSSCLFLTLTLQYSTASRNRNLPTQFQASCYPKCYCNATTVECRNLNEQSTEVFEHILPKIYPDLDTVAITGNDFGKLPADNLFGDATRHLKMTMLDLSDNNIQSFFADTFFGGPRVEFLYLRNNAIETVGSKPLDYLPALRVIDMTAAFGEGVSSRKKAEIIGDMLESAHKFKHLEELILSSNGLMTLDPDIFCKLENLGRLILADNSFQSLNLNGKCLPSLRLLDLRNNRFTTVPTVVYKTLDLNTIDISQNPLQCDCQLEEFIKFASEDPSIFSNQGKTTCDAPSEFAGKEIYSIDLEKENLCQRKSRLLHWIIFILLIVGGVYIYRHLKRSGRIPRMPTVFGYSQLKSNDEASNQPAFV